MRHQAWDAVLPQRHARRTAPLRIADSARLPVIVISPTGCPGPSAGMEVRRPAFILLTYSNRRKRNTALAPPFARLSRMLVQRADGVIQSLVSRPSGNYFFGEREICAVIQLVPQHGWRRACYNQCGLEILCRCFDPPGVPVKFMFTPAG